MSDRYKTGPRQLRSCVVVLSEEETARVRRFVVKVGLLGAARKRLGLGDFVFEAARGFGRMQSLSRLKVLAALDREEAAS